MLPLYTQKWINEGMKMSTQGKEIKPNLLHFLSLNSKLLERWFLAIFFNEVFLIKKESIIYSV